MGCTAQAPNILPGNPRDYSVPGGDAVFEVGGRLILVEIAVVETLSVRIEGRVGPIDQSGEDQKSLTALLRPGACTGRCRQEQSRRTSEAGRRNQASKPGLSRRTRSSSAAQAISLKNSFDAISPDCPKTRSCIVSSHSISAPPAWAMT